VLSKLSLEFTAFLQATGIFVYCLLIGSIMLNGNHWFGSSPSILGPALFLSLFIVSAVITSLMFLGQAFLLFWDSKQPKKAVKLVIFTTLWLSVYILSIIAFLVAQK